MLLPQVLSILACVVLGIPLQEIIKKAASAIYADGDEQAGRPLSKRNSVQFGAMILCEVKRNPLDYNGYGCWCGIGGKGEPVDEIDRCCQIHDKCYDDIIDKNTCGKKDSVLLLITYKTDGCTGCADTSIIGNTRCQKKLCECDAAAARCFKKYDPKFKNRYKNHEQSSCQTLPARK